MRKTGYYLYRCPIDRVIIEVEHTVGIQHLVTDRKCLNQVPA